MGTSHSSADRQKNYDEKVQLQYVAQSIHTEERRETLPQLLSVSSLQKISQSFTKVLHSSTIRLIIRIPPDRAVLLLPLPQDAVQIVTLSVRYEEAAHVVLSFVTNNFCDGLEVLSKIPHGCKTGKSRYSIIGICKCLGSYAQFNNFNCAFS